jgi:hypothetical protein
MSTKHLAVNTVKALAWDQALGHLDVFIFYPLLWFLTLNYGYFICFIITTPCYFVFSGLIVWTHYRVKHKKNKDLFGMHFMQEIAQSTVPPRFGKNLYLYPWHRLKLVFGYIWNKKFYESWQIIYETFAYVQVKIQSWLLSNRWLLYILGTLHVFDPSSVFMFTQKCENKEELLVNAFKKLLPLVVWHIAYWSLIFFAATKGLSWIVKP